MIHPENSEEVLEVVRQARENGVVLRVFGGSVPVQKVEHQQKDGEQEMWLNLDGLRQLVDCDPDRQMATVGSGMRLSELLDVLRSMNLTLPLLGPLPDLTLVDAISLGLVGPNVSIADVVEKCEIVVPNGSLRELSWPSEDDKTEDNLSLQSVVCGLGLAGAVTSVTLKCQPLHLILENNREYSLTEFLGHWEKFTQICYAHARWFALVDTFLVTSAFSMRLHLSYPQPFHERVAELAWRGLACMASGLRGWLAWLFPSAAAVLSATHCYCLQSALARRTNYCFPAQQLMSPLRHCRGIKWVVPSDKRSEVLEDLAEWVHRFPHLCSSPAEICVQRHNRKTHAFLSPHTSTDTFTIWVDWFDNTSVYFSAERAEYESFLQQRGGRKCWCVGPLSVSPLIGELYPGFREWRATRLLLDKTAMLQSAYVQGDFIISKI